MATKHLFYTLCSNSLWLKIRHMMDNLKNIVPSLVLIVVSTTTNSRSNSKTMPILECQTIWSQ